MGLGQEVTQILTIKQKQGRSDNFQHHYDKPRGYHVPVHDEGDGEACGDESTAPPSVSGARLLPTGVHAHFLLRAPVGEGNHAIGRYKERAWRWPRGWVGSCAGWEPLNLTCCLFFTQPLALGLSLGPICGLLHPVAS